MTSYIKIKKNYFDVNKDLTNKVKTRTGCWALNRNIQKALKKKIYFISPYINFMKDKDHENEYDEEVDLYYKLSENTLINRIYYEIIDAIKNKYELILAVTLSIPFHLFTLHIYNNNIKLYHSWGIPQFSLNNWLGVDKDVKKHDKLNPTEFKNASKKWNNIKYILQQLQKLKKNPIGKNDIFLDIFGIRTSYDFRVGSFKMIRKNYNFINDFKNEKLKIKKKGEKLIGGKSKKKQNQKKTKKTKSKKKQKKQNQKKNKIKKIK